MKDIARIVKYSWGLKKYYISTMAFTVIIAVLNQTTPFLLKAAVDGIVSRLGGTNVPLGYFVTIVILLLLSGVSVTLISNLSGYIGDMLGVRLNSFLSQRYYNHVVSLPIGYFDNEVAGRVTSRLDRGVHTISQFVNTMTNNFIGFMLTAILTMIIIAFYSWPLAILLAALFPLYIWLTTLSSKAWAVHQEKINKATDFAGGRFVEVISQIRVVKSFVTEKQETSYYQTKQEEIVATTAKRSIGWHYYDIIRRLSLNLVFFAIYGFIIWQAYLGRYSLGVMTLLINLANQAQFPLFASSFIMEQIQQARSGSKDYFEVMDTLPAITDKSSATKLSVSRGAIEYKDVVFGYDDQKPVLTNVGFSVKPGQKVALVGESGQGKTTLANLLLRFYDIQSGSITIDGSNVSNVTQASLRQAIGVVFQEPALFSGSIADNIGYGSPKATKAQMVDAANAANADGFITKLAHGYDTEIGERGVKLSGGQKQRIAIARAILKNPPILILDEATSSLDSKAEHEVQGALEQLMKKRTTIIIAHRLSTIQNVDMIVGLSDGQVVECGSPAELAKRPGGIYAELLELQNPTKANKARLKKYDIARV
jgi:ATP-binding cassette, subfamily B, bacterial